MASRVLLSGVLALAAPAASVDFARQVEPIFRARCQVCHGPEVQQNGLRLDRRADALRGGYSGPVIVPGASAESKLIRLVSGADPKLIMPPVGPRLAAAEVAALRAWIDQGAVWPESGEAAEVRPKLSRHWSFQPVVRREPPAVRLKARVRNPIDAFVLARLDKEAIDPSPEADRITLFRRLSLDLVGLPPARAEMAEFLADTRPDAYERAVDRLLASPHYGEKWARHWLDLARYADSDGYESDLPRPHAWRYRQWVIEALNRDLPFDQFTIEQLAGDLLPNAAIEQKVAAGFHRNTLTNREGGVDTEQFRVEQVIDRTNTLGTVWLGLSVNCTQCHDHKYDPITQKEYYQLYAFFNTMQESDLDAPLPGEMGPYLAARPSWETRRRALLEEYPMAELQKEWEENLRYTAANPGQSAAWDRAWKFLGNGLSGFQGMILLEEALRTAKQREQLTDYLIQRFNEGFGKERAAAAKIDELRKKLKEVDATRPVVSQAQSVAEFGEPRRTRLLVRGDFRNPGMEVTPAVPAVLDALPKEPKPSRLTLARWVVDRNNPLTARVTVNRMWQELFGRGLVRTSEDFGAQGERPSHPELLDWLASEFMDRGWSMKQMHRLIVTSATYRQASRVRPELESRDPDNILIARQARLRLPAELVRDSALYAAGLLNTAIGGRSIRPPLPKGVAELGYAGGIRWEETKGPERYRRGLYIHFQRTVPYPALMNFDTPDAFLSCSRRQRTNTPLQALNLLNEPMFFEAAQGLALRVLKEAPAGFASRLGYAWELCVARRPEPREVGRMAALFEKQVDILRGEAKEAAALFPHPVDGVEPVEAAAWAAAARVLLNLDEFLHRE